MYLFYLYFIWIANKVMTSRFLKEMEYSIGGLPVLCLLRKWQCMACNESMKEKERHQWWGHRTVNVPHRITKITCSQCLQLMYGGGRSSLLYLYVYLSHSHLLQPFPAIYKYTRIKRRQTQYVAKHIHTNNWLTHWQRMRLRSNQVWPAYLPSSSCKVCITRYVAHFMITNNIIIITTIIIMQCHSVKAILWRGGLDCGHRSLRRHHHCRRLHLGCLRSLLVSHTHIFTIPPPVSSL